MLETKRVIMTRENKIWVMRNLKHATMREDVQDMIDDILPKIRQDAVKYIVFTADLERDGKLSASDGTGVVWVSVSIREMVEEARVLLGLDDLRKAMDVIVWAVREGI